MAYQELIKNFEKVRAYLREFYVYGFKSRTEYDGKSARSYDDERRRVESWLGEYMGFTQTLEGKNVFLSVDSRVTKTNPFYKAWKAKSFTDGDITLHFAIFDVLYDPSIQKTLTELIEDIDERLDSALAFDESTLRKKLKEYESEGIIRIEKEGRKVLYSRTPGIDISQLIDTIDFFSEAAPCGVIGSFLQERLPEHEERFAFKHHYITQAMDSAVMEALFEAIRLRRYVTIDNLGKRAGEVKTVRLVPLKIYISAQNGRQNLIAFHERGNRIGSYRLDYITKVKIDEPCEEFDRFREILKRAESHMWGVNCKWNPNQTEQVEFEIRVGENEQFIVQRLEREKRCGRVERVDESHYRYVAEVYDTTEMIPWIRTFLSRITKMNFSNRTAENQFKADIEEMYRMYGIEGGDGDVV
ncbi:MAG: WYL domain-containing protein [Firmicutes bacterium]|nr:WYL domain-containing protein [Bacillota bacterium]